jgi:hypothetical protein
MPYLNLFLVFSLLLLSCHKQDRDLSVNALAVSSVSSILVDRQICWWHQETSDTLLLSAGILYGTSVGFYHIDGTDTINVSEQVLAAGNNALLFWETTDSSAIIEFKGGIASSRGTQGFYESNQSGGPYTLRLKLLYQADPDVQTGDLMLTAFVPVVVQ